MDFEGIDRWKRPSASNCALREKLLPHYMFCHCCADCYLTQTWSESQYVYQQRFPQVTVFASAYLFHIGYAIAPHRNHLSNTAALAVLSCVPLSFPCAKAVAVHLQHCFLKKFWPLREALHIRKSQSSLSDEAAFFKRKISLGITKSVEDIDSVQWICHKAVLWHVCSSLFLSVVSSAQQPQPSPITAVPNDTSHCWPFSLWLWSICFCISPLISQNNLSMSIPWQAKPCPAVSSTGFWSLPWLQSLYQ